MMKVLNTFSKYPLMLGTLIRISDTCCLEIDVEIGVAVIV